MDLRQTPLHAWHAAHGGRLVDFAGWSMPVQYRSIIEEHRATRDSCGLFDVSHMGRLRIDGRGAIPFLDRVLTRRVSDLKPGQIRYSLVTGIHGGILDDVLVYRLADENPSSCLLVVNASNRDKIRDWLLARRAADSDLSIQDETVATAMIAVQGPRAVDLAEQLTRQELRSMKYYWSRPIQLDGQEVLISRTGYTGEDGVEIIVPAEIALSVWQGLCDLGGQAAGLGARDTLRLEAGMPLYGHELSETINPWEAGLRFAVDLEGRQFPGRDALAALADVGPARQLVGILVEGKRVPRADSRIVVPTGDIGYVTSGTFSPTLERPIAIGYVQQAYAGLGTSVAIDVRGQMATGQVVSLPFYRRRPAN